MREEREEPEEGGGGREEGRRNRVLGLGSRINSTRFHP
jgi:hypothetical protein